MSDFRSVTITMTLIKAKVKAMAEPMRVSSRKNVRHLEVIS